MLAKVTPVSVLLLVAEQSRTESQLVLEVNTPEVVKVVQVSTFSDVQSSGPSGSFKSMGLRGSVGSMKSKSPSRPPLKSGGESHLHFWPHLLLHFGFCLPGLINTTGREAEIEIISM